MADFDASGLAGTVLNIAGAGIAVGMLAGLGRNMVRMTDPDYYRSRGTYNRRPVQRQYARREERPIERRQYNSFRYEPRRSQQMTLKIPKGMPYLSIPQSRLRSIHRPLWR